MIYSQSIAIVPKYNHLTWIKREILMGEIRKIKHFLERFWNEASGAPIKIKNTLISREETFEMEVNSTEEDFVPVRGTFLLQ